MTSRASNLWRDWQGVDLTGTEPFNVQAKCYKSFSVLKAIQTLDAMPNEKNINIAHIKLTNKGEVVVIKKEDRYRYLESKKQP